MLIRYSGGNFNSLLINKKRFVWFIYEELQLDKTSKLTLLPTWIKPISVITKLIEDFPNITFVESMYDEVIDELIEMGYQTNLHTSDGGLWDDYNKILVPLIIGFDKGWKKVDSIGECYCTETLTDIMFEVFPDEFNNYLNQPV